MGAGDQVRFCAFSARSWPVLRTPDQAATGILAYSTAETTSHVIMTARGGSRSIQAPDAAGASPSARGEFSRSRNPGRN